MAEEAYNNKISDLQKHIPFLENMILQLKDPKGKPREAQLNKMESLYSMITDRNKKWKFDTLLKCEEVIHKLQTKVKANRPSLIPEVRKEVANTADRAVNVSQTVNEIMNALKFNNARAKLNSEMSTPKSPSPVREFVRHCPRIIPFEATDVKNKGNDDPNNFNRKTWTGDASEDRYVKETPDIYSSAAKSLTSSKPSFSKLGPTIPQVSKPLLSDADLKMLTSGDDFVGSDEASPGQEKPKEKPSVELGLTKVAPRIVPVPSSKPKSPRIECDDKHANKSKSPKVEKLKDCNIFGNILSSIDSKLLEDNKKKDKRKDEKKHGDTNKKDHSDKKTDRSRHKDRKDNHKNDKRSDKRSKSDKTEPENATKLDVNETPSDKPKRLADKYNPKPRKHDVDKPAIEPPPKIDEPVKVNVPFVENYESRDPRRRPQLPQNMPSLMQLSVPSPAINVPAPLPQKRPENNVAPTDPRRPIRYSPPPSVQLSAYSNVNYSNFMNGPGAPNQGFNQPPVVANQVFNQPSVVANAQFNQSSVVPNQVFNQPVVPNPQVFNQPRPDVNFSTNAFGNAGRMGYQNFQNGPQTYQNASPRFDGNLNGRFEPPDSYNSNSAQFNRKNFCPFEPLDNAAAENSDFFASGGAGGFQNASHQSRAFDDGYRRGGYQKRGKFNYGFNRLDRRFDRNQEKDNRQFNKHSRDLVKVAREDETKCDVRDKSVKDDESKETAKCPKDIPRTKYDEIYSKLEKDKETFSSPLECLYSTPKSSAKPMQSFKIPKKPKPEKVEESAIVPETKDKLKSLSAKSSDDKPSKPKEKKFVANDTDSDSDSEPIKPVRKRISNRKAKTIAKKKLLEDSDEDDEMNESSDEPKGNKKGPAKKPEVLSPEPIVEVKAPEKEAVVEVEKKEPEKPLIDAKSSKELLDEVRKENVEMDDRQVLQFILKNYEKIKKMIKNDSGDEDEKDKKDVKVDVKDESEPAKVETLIEDEEPVNEEPEVHVAPKRGPKPKAKIKKVPKAKTKPVIANIKTRITRNTVKGVIFKKSRRSELDKLHDDIKEMLMGGDVLTSSGKRSCTMQKDEDVASAKKSDTEDDTVLSNLIDRSKLKAKSARLRVLIEKTDLGKLLNSDVNPKDDDSIDSSSETTSSLFKSPGSSSKTESVESSTTDSLDGRPKSPYKGGKLSKKKKRINTWASGVIKKKPKKKMVKSNDGEINDGTFEADSISEDGSIDSMESSTSSSSGMHDKTYFAAEPKPECRLCSFKGKYIVQHYKNLHPDSEVLISRMRPEVSEDAINEAIERNYDAVNPVDTFMDESNTRKKKFNFKCGFCEMALVEFSEIFYDHLGSHTGEFRFSCVYCTFRTSSVKNLRAHISSSHNRSSENCVKPSWPAPPNYKHVFGYICRACNFVQLDRSLVEEHVKSHRQNRQIYKINMSLPCDDDDDDVNPPIAESSKIEEKLSVDEMHQINATIKVDAINKHVIESIESVVNNVASVTEPSGLKRIARANSLKKETSNAQVRDLSVFELINQMAENDKVGDENAETDDAVITKEPVQEPPKKSETVLIKTEPEDAIESQTQTVAQESAPVAEIPSNDCVPDIAPEKVVPPERPIKEEIVEKEVPVEEKRKSPDLTVFMCDSDLVVEEQSIEENRLKKMKEISETIKSSRTSIVDKLQSRLETTEAEPTVGVAPVVQTIDNVKPPPLVPIDRSKKFIDVPAKKDVISAKPMSDDVVLEKVGQISNIINRLQDQLGPTPDLPPLVHYREISPGSSFECLTLGSVKLMAKMGQTLYGCLVATCVFCTENRMHFETHCKTTHGDFPISLAVPGKCDICNIKIDCEKNYVSMYDAFNHLISGHAEFLKKFEAKCNFKLPHEVPNLISQGNDEGAGPKFPFIITSVTSLARGKKSDWTASENPVETTEKIQLPIIQSIESLAPKPKIPEIRAVPISQLCATTTVPNVVVSSTAVPSTPIILNSLLPQAKKTYLRSTIGGNNKQPIAGNNKQPIVSNNKQSIAGNNMQSIAGNNTQPIAVLPKKKINVRMITPIKPAGGDSPPKRIVLRDIPMKGEEMVRERKNPTALAALLTPRKIRQLFKCPEYSCTYSTDYSVEFNNHILIHKALKNQVTPCLYCDYKIQIENYSIHVELKHGHCEYGCEYCFYRATNTYFVTIHNEMKHPQRDLKVIFIQTFASNLKAISGDERQPLRKLLNPYICGQGCNFKTLFTDDFLDHLTNVHKNVANHLCGKCGKGPKTISTADAMIMHWTVHRVHLFHCRYCPFGAKSMDDVGKHQAIVHFSLAYGIICRVFMKDSSNLTARSFTFDEDAMYDKLLKLPEHVDTLEGKEILAKNKLKSSCFGGKDEEELPSTSTMPTTPVKPGEIEVIQMAEPDTITKDTPNDQPALPIRTDDSQKPYEEPEILTKDLENSNEVDPLTLDCEDAQTEAEKQPANEISMNLFDESNDGDYIDIESDVPEQKDLVGLSLYKCVCSKSFPSSHYMKMHILESHKEKPFYCGHCSRTCKTVYGLMMHYQEHGRNRFKCSLCQFKHRHPVGVRNHMKVIHNITKTMLLPVVCKKDDLEKDDFVLRPKQQQNQISTDFSSGTDSSVDSTTADWKWVYLPNEIDQLPRQPIYQTDVKCGMCVYATKVKSNMVRHLLFHQTEQDVPGSAPVNPVPCLEKSERMFDKMVNLAASSHTAGRLVGLKAEKIVREGNVHVPQFIPENHRYVCGAENCNYLCPEEGMLRRHLTAFHAQDGSYSCLHCNIKISEEKTLSIESVMKHLKLHDLLLYQCGHCTFMHNLKHKVERHQAEKHLNKPSSLIVLREMEKEVVEAESETVIEKDVLKEQRPWKCGMCKYRSGTMMAMKAHCHNKHNIESRYKCAICAFKSEDKNEFQDHFDANHVGHKVNFIVCYFNDDKVVVQRPDPEVEFNTAPLWQRNKSVKHIRGILLEETSNAKMLKNPVVKKLKMMKPKRSDSVGTDGEKSDDLASPSTPTKVELNDDKKVSMITVASFAKLSTNKLQKKGVKRSSKSNKIIKVGGIKIGEFKGYKEDEEIIDITSDEAEASLDDDLTIMKESNEITKPVAKEPEGNESTNDNVDNLVEDTLQKCQTVLENVGVESDSFVESEENTATLNDNETPPNLRNIKVVSIRSLLDPEPNEEPLAGIDDLQQVDVETIEINDDDGELRSPKKQKTDLTIKQIAKMSKDELINGNFVGTYGPFGSPWSGMYKCPLCEKLTFKTEKQFSMHLYRELDYGTFKCRICQFTGITASYVKKHYLSKHGPLLEDDIIQTTWDPQIEIWIHKVIAYQGRILMFERDDNKSGGSGQKSEGAVQEPPPNETKILSCTFCEYRCKYASDMKKHELRHWSTKRFTCSYCNYGGLSKQTMLKHTQRVHRDQEPKMTESDLGSSVIIKSIKLVKRKSSLPMEEADLSQNEDEVQNDPMDTNDPAQTDEHHRQLQADTLKCYYCGFIGIFSEQKRHTNDEHPEVAVRVYRYKCNYCDTTFISLVGLNKHFFAVHPGLPQDFENVVPARKLLKYQCPRCPASYNELDKIRHHVRSYVKPFQCMYCDAVFSYWQQISKHHEVSHLGSAYEYRYLLNVESEGAELIAKISVNDFNAIAKKRKELASANQDDDDVLIVEGDDATAPPVVKKQKVPEAVVTVKRTARKSTGGRKCSEGFSYYGTKPDDAAAKTVRTTVDILGASVTMCVEQLSNIFNLFPEVVVEDCAKNKSAT